MPGTRLPFGRSKWLHTITLAPASDSSRMVGASRSMRVRSLIRPSRTGTLRSARSSTRLPATSTPSSVRNAIGYRLPNSAAVSTMRLEKPHSLSYQPITRASAPSTTAVCVASKVQRGRAVVEVAADQLLGVVVEDALQRALAGRLHGGVDLLDRWPCSRRFTSSETSETLGVGTRIEVPSSLPFSSGITRPTALAAPVLVGMS